MKKEIKWYYPENWEKYSLILMSLVGFFTYTVLVVMAYTQNNPLFEYICAFYFILVCIDITGMIIRKGMKYKISKSGLEFGYDSQSTPTITASVPTTSGEGEPL